MATLFHLLFESLRISLLSLLYGFLIWFVFSKLLKVYKFKVIKIILLIFVSLIIWRFSYWRNNGLGDFGRVPLSSDYEITMIDWQFSEILKNGEPIEFKDESQLILELYQSDNFLFARTDKSYFVLGLDYGLLLENLSKDKFLDLNGNPEKFMTLNKFHSNYWNWKKLIFL